MVCVGRMCKWANPAATDTGIVHECDGVWGCGCWCGGRLSLVYLGEEVVCVCECG